MKGYAYYWDSWDLDHFTNVGSHFEPEEEH